MIGNFQDRFYWGLPLVTEGAYLAAKVLFSFPIEKKTTKKTNIFVVSGK
jgi:hypothetical protein